MCGLFGYWGTPLSSDKVKLLSRVGDSQAARGRDAFGIAWRTEHGNGSSGHIFKQSGSISDNLPKLRMAADAFALIGHTRWTTHGSADLNDNNHPHPFSFQNRKCWLAHNGIIQSYRTIADRFGLELRTECDSEILCRYIEEANGNILTRVREIVSHIDSDAPFAMSALMPDGLVLARRGNPLFWSETKNRCWFASTSTALCGKVHEVPNCKAFFIPFAGGETQSVDLPEQRYSSRHWIGSTLFA